MIVMLREYRSHAKNTVTSLGKGLDEILVARGYAKWFTVSQDSAPKPSPDPAPRSQLHQAPLQSRLRSTNSKRG